MQDAINKLCSDNARKNSKKILVDMLDKAVDKQINPIITREKKKERRVLTVYETEQFLKQAEGTFYYELFALALETGMRIGELCGLTWEDIDFRDKLLYVRHTLCYFSKGGKYVFENGMQPKVLSKLLGHGQLQITMDLYCHVMEDTLVEEMKKMERKCV